MNFYLYRKVEEIDHKYENTVLTFPKGHFLLVDYMHYLAYDTECHLNLPGRYPPDGNHNGGTVCFYFLQKIIRDIF